MRLKIFLFLILSYSLCFAEWKYSDYEKTDHTNFRQNPIFQQIIDPDNIDYPLAHAAIFFVTNETRVKNGLPALEFSKELEMTAWDHSRSMVENNFFSHKNPYNREKYEPADRAKLAGVTNPYIAENIAESFGIRYNAGVPLYPRNTSEGAFSYTPNGEIIKNHTYLSLAESLVNQWMNSSGHRANILSKSALQMGCGIYFYRDKNFYNMLKCRATQNFQWFRKIIPATTDALSPSNNSKTLKAP
ncbi:MAG TPA: CAP domain-containing protein [Spirochaetota bacterium]|mgnify:FL=1|nr:CAP domain-containing protein [Spirochaetota bacterium]